MSWLEDLEKENDENIRKSQILQAEFVKGTAAFSKCSIALSKINSILKRAYKKEIQGDVLSRVLSTKERREIKVNKSDTLEVERAIVIRRYTNDLPQVAQVAFVETSYEWCTTFHTTRVHSQKDVFSSNYLNPSVFSRISEESWIDILGWCLWKVDINQVKEIFKRFIE